VLVSKSFGNQSDAARALGVSRPTLQRYINGSTSPDLKFAVRLCEAAGARIHWLATGEGVTDAVRSDENLPAEVVREAVESIFSASKAFPTLSAADLSDAVIGRVEQLLDERMEFVVREGEYNVDEKAI
jgi:transcriptional regulator with XRE-family HTH domain